MPTYAWSRLDIDEGLGLVGLDTGDPIRVEGHEVAVDRHEAWAVTFRVELDRGWRTRVAQVAVGRSIEWLVDGLTTSVLGLLIVGSLFDVSLAPSQVLRVIPLLLLVIVATYGMGTLLGAIVLRKPDVRNVVLNLGRA